MDRAYDRFNVELRRVQVLYSKSGTHHTHSHTHFHRRSDHLRESLPCDCFCTAEGWRSARLQGSSPQHILQPMDFAIQLAKCMVDNDTRMPRYTSHLWSGDLDGLACSCRATKSEFVLQVQGVWRASAATRQDLRPEDPRGG